MYTSMFKGSRFEVLIALYVFGVLVAELMGGKTFHLFTIGGFVMNASVAIFVMPLLFTLTDVVVEVHGSERARQVVRLGLMVIALQLVTALLFTTLPPSHRYEHTEAAYDTIFGTSIRFAVASLVAFAISEMLDVAVFAKLRKKLGKKSLWLRNNLSNFASQLVDSAVFLTIAFFSFSASLNSNVSFIVGLLIPYWLLRCALSVIETPFVYMGVKWLKKDLAQPAVVAHQNKSKAKI